MSSQPTRQDLEHLNLLAVFYYIMAGLIGLGGFIPIIHVAMGLFMISTARTKGGADAELATVGMFFVLFAAAIMLALWALAVCTALAGRFLQQQRHYIFCMVVAALLCTNAPLGTTLGVFTIIVLVRPSVKTLFEATNVVLSDP